jgi:sulfate adenylyltransferase large subunit
MSHQSELIAKDILAYLEQHERKELLRFITCGSVDDGKSTLIGRMLYDAGQVFDDQLEALDEASKKFGTIGQERDYALLVDGLAAEREQGITIDVAYRYFRTPKRVFIVADTPGHEQYTRNMATGASNAELAIILIDARKGVLPQTRRHALITSLMGVKKIVLAINKMDLVDYSQQIFEEIKADFLSHSSVFNFNEITAIPLAAKTGENILAKSENMQWYQGQSLINYLETVQITDTESRQFHFPVQWVNRPNLDFRGFSGFVASGEVKVGDKIRVSSSGQTSNIARIVTYDGDIESAQKGQSLTITLEDEIDVSRGDIISSAKSELRPKTGFTADILWCSATPLSLNKEYLIKNTTSEINAYVVSLGDGFDFDNLKNKNIERLTMNGVAEVEIRLSKPLLVDAYNNNRDLGAFILIDKFTNETIALGMVKIAKIAKTGTYEAVEQFIQRLLPDDANKSEVLNYVKSWYPFSALATFFIVLLVTHRIDISMIAAILELILKPIVQLLHFSAYEKSKKSLLADDENNIDGYGI